MVDNPFQSPLLKYASPEVASSLQYSSGPIYSGPNQNSSLNSVYSVSSPSQTISLTPSSGPIYSPQTISSSGPIYSGPSQNISLAPTPKLYFSSAPTFTASAPAPQLPQSLTVSTQENLGLWPEIYGGAYAGLTGIPVVGPMFGAGIDTLQGKKVDVVKEVVSELNPLESGKNFARRYEQGKKLYGTAPPLARDFFKGAAIFEAGLAGGAVLGPVIGTSPLAIGTTGGIIGGTTGGVTPILDTGKIEPEKIATGAAVGGALGFGLGYGTAKIGALLTTQKPVFQDYTIDSQSKGLLPLIKGEKIRIPSKLETAIMQRAQGISSADELGGWHINPLNQTVIPQENVFPEVVAHEAIHGRLKDLGLTNLTKSSLAAQAVSDDMLLAKTAPPADFFSFFTGRQPGMLKNVIETTGGYSKGPVMNEEILARFVNIYPGEVANPTTQTGYFLNQLLSNRAPEIGTGITSAIKGISSTAGSIGGILSKEQPVVKTTMVSTVPIRTGSQQLFSPTGKFLGFTDTNNFFNTPQPKVNVNLPSNATARDVINAGNIVAQATIDTRKPLPTQSESLLSNIFTPTVGNIMNPKFDANQAIYSQFPGLSSTDIATKTTAATNLYQQLSSNTPISTTNLWDTQSSIALARAQDTKNLESIRQNLEKGAEKTYFEKMSKTANAAVDTEAVRQAYFNLKKSQVVSPQDAFSIVMDPGLTQNTKLQISLGLIPANKEFAKALQTVQSVKNETTNLATLIIKNKPMLEITQADYDKFVADVKPKFDEYNNFVRANTINTKPDGTAVLSPENLATLEYIAKKNDLQNLSTQWDNKNTQLNNQKDTYNSYVEKYNANILNETTAVDNINKIADRLNAPGEAFKQTVSSLSPYGSMAIAKYGFTPYAARESVTGSTPVTRAEALIYEKDWRDPNFLEFLGTQAQYTSGFDIGKTISSGSSELGKYYSNPIALGLGPLSIPFAATSIYQDYSKNPDKYLQAGFELNKTFDNIKLTSGKYEDLPEVYRQSSQIQRIQDFYAPFDTGKAGQKVLGYTTSGAVTGATYGGVTGALAGGVGAIPGAAAGAVTGGLSGLAGSIADIGFSETLGRSSGSRRGGEAVGLVGGIAGSILANMAIAPVLNPVLIGKSKPEIYNLAEQTLEIKKVGEDTYKLFGKGTGYPSTVQYGTGLFNKGVDYSGSTIKEFGINLTFKNTANVGQPGVSVIEKAGGLPEATLSNMKVGETIPLSQGTTFESFLSNAGNLPNIPGTGIMGGKQILSNNEDLTRFLKNLSDNTLFDIKGSVKVTNLDTGKITTTLIKNSSVVSADVANITRIPTTIKVSEGTSSTKLTSAEKALQNKLASMKPGERALYQLTPDESILMESASLKQATTLTSAEKAIQNKLASMDSGQRALYKLTPNEESLMESALQKQLARGSLNTAKKIDTVVNLDNLNFDLKSYSNTPSGQGKWSWYRTPEGQAELADTLVPDTTTKVTSQIYNPIKGGTAAKMQQSKLFLDMGKTADVYNDFSANIYYSDIGAKPLMKPTVGTVIDKADDLFASGKINADEYAKLLQDATGANTGISQLSKTTIDTADDLLLGGKITPDEYSKLILGTGADTTRVTKSMGYFGGSQTPETIVNKGGSILLLQPAQGALAPAARTTTQTVSSTAYADLGLMTKMYPGVQQALAQAFPVVEQKLATGLSFGVPYLMEKTEARTFSTPVTKLDYAPLVTSEKIPYMTSTITTPIFKIDTALAEKVKVTPIEKVGTSEKIDTVQKVITEEIIPTYPYLISAPGPPLIPAWFPPGSYTPSTVGFPQKTRKLKMGRAPKKRDLIQFKSSLFRKFAFGEKDLLVNKEDVEAFRNIIAEKGTFLGYDLVPTREQISREELRLAKKDKARGILGKENAGIMDIMV